MVLVSITLPLSSSLSLTLPLSFFSSFSSHSTLHQKQPRQKGPFGLAQSMLPHSSANRTCSFENVHAHARLGGNAAYPSLLCALLHSCASRAVLLPCLKYRACLVSMYTMACRVWALATCCNTRQHTATHCDTLQHSATNCNMHLMACRLVRLTRPRLQCCRRNAL